MLQTPVDLHVGWRWGLSVWPVNSKHCTSLWGTPPLYKPSALGNSTEYQNTEWLLGREFKWLAIILIGIYVGRMDLNTLLNLIWWGSQVGNRHFSVLFLSVRRNLYLFPFNMRRGKKRKTKGYGGRKQSSELCIYRRQIFIVMAVKLNYSNLKKTERKI